VEAITVDGSVSSEAVTFEVASPEQHEELSSVREKLAPLMESEDSTREDAAAYLLGTYCRSTGFLNEAITQLETVVLRNPDRKELHRELGYLYQAVGRNDKAVESYRLALKE
jgi:Tfp pilus assembly protein PilF